jgi:hypothetical protein
LKDANPRAVERFLAAHAGLAGPLFPIEELILYSSLLSASGATHQVEERFKLKPPEAAKT